ncbi:hypothetical protein A4S06_04700 [Erysipelotrichaceae bacterium MTC7]|nr:hypothetical protein A4S06_04700 [Erysipelotrichaceae bacterium MTC7]
MVNELKEQIKQAITIPFVLCVVCIALTFYGLPSIIKDTGSGMMVLMAVMPILVFIFAAANGYLARSIMSSLFFALLVLVLFIPAIFIYFNQTAWVYVIVYALVALVAGFVAFAIKKYNNKK